MEFGAAPPSRSQKGAKAETTASPWRSRLICFIIVTAKLYSCVSMAFGSDFIDAKKFRDLTQKWIPETIADYSVHFRPQEHIREWNFFEKHIPEAKKLIEEEFRVPNPRGKALIFADCTPDDVVLNYLALDPSPSPVLYAILGRDLEFSDVVEKIGDCINTENMKKLQPGDSLHETMKLDVAADLFRARWDCGIMFKKGRKSRGEVVASSSSYQYKAWMAACVILLCNERLHVDLTICPRFVDLFQEAPPPPWEYSGVFKWSSKKLIPSKYTMISRDEHYALFYEGARWRAISEEAKIFDTDGKLVDYWRNCALQSIDDLEDGKPQVEYTWITHVKPTKLTIDKSFEGRVSVDRQKRPAENRWMYLQDKSGPGRSTILRVSERVLELRRGRKLRIYGRHAYVAESSIQDVWIGTILSDSRDRSMGFGDISDEEILCLGIKKTIEKKKHLKSVARYGYARTSKDHLMSSVSCMDYEESRCFVFPNSLKSSYLGKRQRKRLEAELAFEPSEAKKSKANEPTAKKGTSPRGQKNDNTNGTSPESSNLGKREGAHPKDKLASEPGEAKKSKLNGPSDEKDISSMEHQNDKLNGKLLSTSKPSIMYCGIFLGAAIMVAAIAALCRRSPRTNSAVSSD